MRKNKISNLILIVSTILVFLSGMLIHSPELTMLMTAIHKISACSWLVLVLVHVSQYTKKKYNKQIRNIENEKMSQ